MDFIRKQIEESVNVKNLILDYEKILKLIKETAKLCCDALQSDWKIRCTGNNVSRRNNLYNILIFL
jgi:phosphoheptose isomerase